MTDQQLFPNQYITFQMPFRTEYDKLVKFFNDCFNKTELEKYCNDIKKVIPYPCKVFSSGKELDITSYLPNKKAYAYSKEDHARFCALVHCCPENLSLVISLVSPEYRQVLGLMLNNGSVSCSELKAMKLSKFIYESNDWYYTQYHSGYCCQIFLTGTSSGENISAINKHYYSQPKDGYMAIPTLLRKCYSQALYPHTIDPDFCYEDSLEPSLEIVESETDFVNSFLLISGLSRQDLIKARMFKLSASSAARIIAKTDIKEIFNESVTNVHKISVGQFFLPILDSAIFKSESNDMKDILKLAVEFLNRAYICDLLPAFLPHIKGFRSNKLPYSKQYYSEILLACLGARPSVWVNLNALPYYCRNIIDTEGKFGFPLSLQYLYDYSVTNSFAKRSVYFNTQFKDIHVEIFKACAAALYGLGLVDLALDSKKTNTQSPCEHIRYARITNLGKYIIGIDKEYKGTANKDVKHFELDPERLIIKSLDADSPYKNLLSGVAEYLGNSRYRLNYKSFLSNCSSQRDVEEKISFFNDFICDDAPQIWKDFFKELKNRCSPLIEESLVQYNIFRIDRSNKEIMDLLSRDKELRSMIIMAEGYRILVKSNCIKEFTNRMKAFGYLI